MNNDPLAQLRDIRLPLEPDWWPLAFGWWIVAALTLAGLIALVYLMVQAYRARRPIRAVKQLMQELFDEHSSGNLTDIALVHASNTLLKRLLVVALGINSLAKASSTHWLEALDKIAASSDFTQGPGQILGLQRFNPTSTADIAKLKQLLVALMAKVHPTKTKLHLSQNESPLNSAPTDQQGSAHD